MIGIKVFQGDLDTFESPFVEQILNGATGTTKKDMNIKNHLKNKMTKNEWWNFICKTSIS